MRISLSIAVGLLVGSFLLFASILAQAPVADDTGPIFPDDYDGDGILDEFDNCIETWNGLPDAPVPPPRLYRNYACDPQYDADEDAYGNACDFDFNNDGLLGFDDCIDTIQALSTILFPPSQVDVNCDGGVGLDDVALVLQNIGYAPGPSALECSVANVKFSCPPIISW